MLTGRKRNNLVVIQTFTEATGQWNNVKTWAESSQAWVSINPVRGRERFLANEVESVVSHMIRGDYMELSGVTEEMQVVYHDSMDYSDLQYSDFDNAKSAAAKVFLIHAVLLDYEERGDCVLVCEEEGRSYAALRQAVS